MLNCKSKLQVGGDVQWSIPVPSSHAPWINRVSCGFLLVLLGDRPTNNLRWCVFFVYTENLGTSCLLLLFVVCFLLLLLLLYQMTSLQIFVVRIVKIGV